MEKRVCLEIKVHFPYNIMNLKCFQNELDVSQGSKTLKSLKSPIASFQYRIRDHCLLLKSTIVLFVVIVMFFLSSFVETLYITIGRSTILKYVL